MRLTRGHARRLVFAVQGSSFSGLTAYALGRYALGLSGTLLALVTVAVAVAISIAVDAFLTSLFAGLELARLGKRHERLAVARRPRAVSLEAKITRCANANESGDLALAEECLATILAADEHHSLTCLVRDRLDVLRDGDPARRDAAIERLIEWKRPGVLLSDEMERYHAFALASSLTGEVGSARAQRAAAILLAHADPIVRGYGSWLTLRIDPSAAELPELIVADPRQGAELARAAGEPEIADALETEIARRALVADAPYRRPR